MTLHYISFPFLMCRALVASRETPQAAAMTHTKEPHTNTQYDYYSTPHSYPVCRLFALVHFSAPDANANSRSISLRCREWCRRTDRRVSDDSKHFLEKMLLFPHLQNSAKNTIVYERKQKIYNKKKKKKKEKTMKR